MPIVYVQVRTAIIETKTTLKHINNVQKNINA